MRRDAADKEPQWKLMQKICKWHNEVAQNRPMLESTGKETKNPEITSKGSSVSAGIKQQGT
jgi:hypothetical protein